MIAARPGLDVTGADPFPGMTLLVNPVNAKGVMGRGLARDFARRYPGIVEPYRLGCLSGRMGPGALRVDRVAERVAVVGLATKGDWRDPSHEDDVAAGTVLLAELIRREAAKGPVRALVPMLGCGLGGLDPVRVATMMGGVLGRSPGEVLVSVPDDPRVAEALAAGPSDGIIAGVGSRKTPAEVLDAMRGAAALLRADGIRTRTGDAAGADAAFRQGAGDDAEVFGPRDGLRESALRVARAFHPAPERIGLPRDAALPNPARASIPALLMARNLFQVIGRGCAPVSGATACWTPGGMGGGGTGQAIRIARSLGIPVIDAGAPGFPGGAESLREAVLHALGREREGPGALPGP